MTAPESRPLTRLSRSYSAQAVDRGWLDLKNFVWVMAALLIGFGLRAYGLAAQSLWNDEGTSIALARTSLPAIANAAAHDIHPPLYYFLLHFWIIAAGTSEYAVRYLSLFAGVLLIAVTFRIARLLFDQEVAVIATGLSVLSAFQVYYSQETRMYIWVTFWGAVSVWAMLCLLLSLWRSNEKPEGRPKRILYFAVYVFATLAALYTQYYAFTLILFENLAFLVWLILAWRKGRAVLRLQFGTTLGWIGAQILVALAFAPWIAFASSSIASWPGISEPMGLFAMAWRILSSFVVGLDAPRDLQVWIVAIYAFFFFFGLLPSRDLFKQSAWGIVVALLWAVVPFVAMFTVSLVRPAYNPKFLLLATPGFLILVARGFSIFYPGLFLRERAPLNFDWRMTAGTRTARQLLGALKFIAAGTMIVGVLAALQGVYEDPRLKRDDYHGIIQYINAVATKDDAVLVDAPGQIDVVRYYLNTPAEVVTLPIGRPEDAIATGAALNDMTGQHQNIFAIYYGTEQADPLNVIGRFLNIVSFQASDEWHGNVRFAQYASPSNLKNFVANIHFGSEISLNQFTIGDRPVHGGTILPVNLEWRALVSPSTDYKVFVHLLDAKGRIVSQHDSEPVGGLDPTSHWKPNDIVQDRVGLWIKPGTPPGDYDLEIGLYRADDGTRLRVLTGDDHVVLGSLTVDKSITEPDAVNLNLTHPSNWDLGDVELLGYALDAPEYQPGDFIPFVVYWRASTKPGSDLNLLMQLVAPDGKIVAQAPAFEAYPTSHWDAGEIVRDAQALTIPSSAEPGEYKLVIAHGPQTHELTRVRVK